MVERAHGIEGVRCMPRSRRDSAFGRLKVGVGMSQADAHTATRCFGNNLGRVIQLGSDRHHADTAARSLPELVEEGERRSEQIFGRVHAAARVADERSLEMDSERDSPTLATFVLAVLVFAIALALLNGIR